MPCICHSCKNCVCTCAVQASSREVLLASGRVQSATTDIPCLASLLEHIIALVWQLSRSEQLLSSRAHGRVDLLSRPAGRGQRSRACTLILQACMCQQWANGSFAAAAPGARCGFDNLDVHSTWFKAAKSSGLAKHCKILKRACTASSAPHMLIQCPQDSVHGAVIACSCFKRSWT